MNLRWTPPPALQQLGMRIDSMTLRERGIMFLLVMGCLFLFADQVLFPTLRTQQRQLEGQINERLGQLKTITTQIDRIVAEGTQDPDVAQRARLEQLQKQFAELQLTAADIVRGLVSPREMRQLVNSMLRENGALELVKAENLPPETITLNAGGNSPALYRHGLRLSVQGRYPDIVRYLRALEKLSWRVMWGEVQLESTRYPVSRVTLTLYTLSLDKAWIGV